MKNMLKVIAATLVLMMALMMSISAFAEEVEAAETIVETPAVVVVEAPKPEAPKAEAPKAEEPKQEAPKAEEIAEKVEEAETDTVEITVTPAPEATEEPASEETTESTEETASEETAETEETASEETEVTEEITEEVMAAEEITEEIQYTASNVTIDVYFKGGASAHIGDTVTVAADINGLEGESYTMQWQYFDGEWHDVEGATADSYSFIVSRTNAAYSWQIIVTVA